MGPTSWTDLPFSVRFGKWWDLPLIALWDNFPLGMAALLPSHCSQPPVSCLFLHFRFPQHCFFLVTITPIIAGHHQGREWESPDGTCSVTLGLFSCFYPFQISRYFSVELLLCLLVYSFPFHSNPTYSLLLKKSSLLLNPLRASFLNLGPHFEFIFYFISYYF